jgi:hypothetical protein
MEGIERIREARVHGGKPPEQMSPEELHSVFWQVLSFRDSGLLVSLWLDATHWGRLLSPVVKKIALVIGRPSIPSVLSLAILIEFSENIPGLGSLIEKITDSISGMWKHVPGTFWHLIRAKSLR